MYQTNPNYKKLIDNAAKENYEAHLKKYFKKLIPHSQISFTNEEDLWCASLPHFGYFIISKDQ